MVKVVVVRIMGAYVGLAMAIVFIVLIAVTILPFIIAWGSPAGYAFIAVLFAILLFRLVRGLLKYRYINSTVNRLLNLVIIREGFIRFRRPVEYTIGRFRSIGFWIGVYRSYQTRYSFEGPSRGIVGDRIDFSTLPTNYTIIINSDREGFIEAPAIRIIDPEFEGGVIMVLRRPKENVLHPEKRSLRTSHGMSFAEASINIDNNVLKASLYKYPAHENRARLEVVGYIGVGNKIIYAKEDVCEVKRQSVNCEWNMFTREDIVIIGHESTLNPWNLSKAMKKAPFMMGYEKGSYLIRLVFETKLRTIIDSVKLLAEKATSQ